MEMVVSGVAPEKSEIVYFDKKVKRSLYNIVPKSFKKLMDDKKVRSRLFEEEGVLRKSIKPSPTLNKLRLRFWKEFDLAQDQTRNMELKRVYRGICPAEQFIQYLDTPDSVVWMLKPPIDYMESMEEALSTGIERLREILELPFYQVQSVAVGGGEYEDREVFNPQIANLVAKTVTMLDQRVRGATVQKIEQKTYSENRTLKASVRIEDIPKLGEEGLAKRIQEMEASLKGNLSKVKKPSFIEEVESKEVLSSEDDL